jgi:hypothetical protein
MMVFRPLFLMTLLFATPLPAAEEIDGPIPGWREVIFDGRTVYNQTQECVKAVSENAASGLVRREKVDLDERPILTWRWRAEEPLRGAEAGEHSKAGDDFLARVYVVHKGFLPWLTRAVSYVWTREVPVGRHWPNPFVEETTMVAVQSGEAGLGEWHRFRRDVRADFQRFHDIEITRVNAVALMTDTDNTGGRARACYQLPQFQARAAGE